MAKTYACGTAGRIMRRDDHTGGWTEITPTAPLSDADTQWNDIMTDPTNEDKVVVVGGNYETGQSPADYSILVSSDAGLTWNTPGGTWNAALDQTFFFEVWYVDTNTIWATGSNGKIVRSVDGGATFDVVSGTVGSGTYYNTAGIFAIDANTAIVLGNDWPWVHSSTLYAWKTTDAGVTWTAVDGTPGVTALPNPTMGGDIGSAKGIWMSPDQQTIVVASHYNHWLSTDGGVTFDDKLDNIARSGEHLTWFPPYSATPQIFRHVGGVQIQVTESSDQGLSWTQTRVLSGVGSPPSVVIRGACFHTPNDGYYVHDHEIHITTDGGVTGTQSFLDTGLPTGGGSGIAQSSFFQAVWTSPEFTPCFELVDCEGVRDTIYTDVDLTAHVGQVITIQDDTGHEAEGCWLVGTTVFNCDTTIPIAVYKCYDDCEDCLPLPEEPEVPKPRAVDPGVTLGANCDIEVVRKAMCEFGEMRHIQAQAKRFGMDVCCNFDEHQTIIDYYKIEMKLRTDIDRTPDPCDPQCWRYEFYTQVGDSTEITYVDCDGEEQTISVGVGGNVQYNTFCAQNTTTPTAVVTHPDTTTDTYYLMPVEYDCVPPAQDARQCLAYEVRMSNFEDIDKSFTYEDCDGNIQTITKIGGFKDIAQYNFCAREGSVTDPTPALLPQDTWQVDELGDCDTFGLPECVGYTVTVNSVVATTIRYVDCNGQDSSVVVNAAKADQIFLFCGIAGQVLTTQGNVHNSISWVEGPPHADC